MSGIERSHTRPRPLVISCVALIPVMAVIGLLAMTQGSAKAQSLDEVRLRVFHRNEPFGEGYNSETHTYAEDHIKKVLLDPDTRAIEASICDSLTRAHLPMQHIDTGKKCPDQEVFLAPEGASAFVWKLRGKHPILNKVTDLQVIPPQGLRPQPAVGPCITLDRRKVADKFCAMRFEAPTASITQTAPSVEVVLEIRGKGGTVLASHSQTITVPRHAPLIVSVGDSFASGEGNPDRPGKSKRFTGAANVFEQRDCKDDTTFMIRFELEPEMVSDPHWMEACDHRSLKSGPARAARELLNEWPYIVFLSFAKSGAKVSDDSEDQPQDQRTAKHCVEEDNDLLEQLTHVKRVVGDHRIDALLVSIGGNDVKFGPSLKKLAGSSRDSDLIEIMTAYLGLISELRNTAYPKINPKIAELGLNVGTVLISEYPTTLFHNENDQPREGCGVFNSFDHWKVDVEAAKAITAMGRHLNEEVKLAATTNGWRLVDGIDKAFVGHGYCTKESFFRAAEDSCDMQGDFNGTIHPNEFGTAAQAQALVKALRAVLPKPSAGPVFD